MCAVQRFHFFRFPGPVSHPARPSAAAKQRQNQRQKDQDEQKHRGGNKNRDIGRAHLHGIRRDTGDLCDLLILDAVAADEQAVRVDAIRCTGDERAEIFTGLDCQRAHLMRLDDQNLVDLIGQRLVERPQNENIPDDQPVQIGEQLCAWQAAMAGKDTMRVFSTDRK